MKRVTAPWGPVAAAILLVTTSLGRQNLWIDEVMSVDAVRGSWSDLARFFTSLPEQHPLYYVLLRGWLVFGESERAVRSLSALCMVLAVPAFAALGTDVAGRRAGTLAAWLAATSPFLLYYGQEARMYALVALLAACSTVAVMRWMSTQKTRWLLLYGALAVAGCYTHFFFTFLVIAHLLGAVASREGRQSAIRRLFGVQVLVALAYTPWALLLAKHMPQGQAWKSAANVEFGVPYTVLRFAVGYAVLPANYLWRQQIGQLITADAPTLALAAFGFGAALVAGMLRLWHTGARGRNALAVMVAPLALALAFSVVTIVVGERYFIVCFPLFLVSVAAGLVKLTGGTAGARRLGWAATAAIAAVTATSLWRYYRSPDFGKEQWADAAHVVREGAKQGDLIAVHRAFAVGAFRYYYRPAFAEIAIGNDDPARLPPASRLWLILSHAADEDDYIARLGVGWRVAFDQRFTHESGIRVLRLDRVKPNSTRAP